MVWFGLFHAPLAFQIIQGLQVNPLGSNPITAPSMTSLVKYSLLLLLTEKMERAPPYIILVKSLESVAFRRLLQDNKNITTDNTVVPKLQVLHFYLSMKLTMKIDSLVGLTQYSKMFQKSDFSKRCLCVMG